MKYMQFVVVGAALLSACASAKRRGGGGDDADLGRSPVLEDFDLSTAEDSEPDLATLLGNVDLAPRDLASSSPLDLATAPRDMATPRDMTSSSPVDLGGGTIPTNAGDTCATAPLLPVGVTVLNQDTTPLHDDYDIGTTPSSACSVFDPYSYDGPDGAYRLVIPAGKTLSVTMVKSNLPTTWDPALAIVTNCANIGPSCLAGSDELTGDTEAASYTNSSGSPLTVYIIIEAFNPDQYGTYSIRADLN